MRLVVQRVSRASVNVGEQVVGAIERGLVVLVGIRSTDSDREIEFLVEKLIHLRIFADEDDKMNLSLLEVQGELLVVSQFTLYGDCRKGRRPSFIDAAPAEIAIPIYERFLARLGQTGVRVAAGIFGAMMQVDLVNDGPVTLILESPE